MRTNQSKTAVIVEKELSYAIINAFYEVYNKLGYGFLESLYAKALENALNRRQIPVEREHAVAVILDGQPIGNFRLDLLVSGRVIVEIKSTETISVSAKRQLRNYLTATGLQLGLLLHFGPDRAAFFRVLGRPCHTPS
jgi:GxxExxY protein